MTLYILDTDHLTLLRKGHPQVTQRVGAVGPDQVAVTIATVDEHLTGWYTQLRRARDSEKLAKAYDGLFQVVESLRRIRVVPYSLPAAKKYFELRKVHRRIGKMDLVIAALVLETGGTLVTRNRADFDEIPGLHIEDWTQPESE
jgi:tRNA(fMet)-specific endonuclease VapC